MFHLERDLGMKLVLVCVYTSFGTGSGNEASLCVYFSIISIPFLDANQPQCSMHQDSDTANTCTCSTPRGFHRL